MNPYGSPKHYCLPTRTVSSGLRGLVISAVGALVVGFTWLFAYFWFVDVRCYAEWYPGIMHGSMVATTVPWLLVMMVFAIRYSRFTADQRNQPSSDPRSSHIPANQSPKSAAT